MKNHEIYHETKSIPQSCSALMIITNMPITQDLSLIPKLGSLRSSLNSDSRILSTWQKKAPLATHNLALRGQQSSRPPLLLSELGFFKEAGELCESLQNHIVRQHSKIASDPSIFLGFIVSKHENHGNPSWDETCSPSMLCTHDNNRHAACTA